MFNGMFSWSDEEGNDAEPPEEISNLMSDFEQFMRGLAERGITSREELERATKNPPMIPVEEICDSSPHRHVHLECGHVHLLSDEVERAIREDGALLEKGTPFPCVKCLLGLSTELDAQMRELFGSGGVSGEAVQVTVYVRQNGNVYHTHENEGEDVEVPDIFNQIFED
jgi:hypothetical protein